MQNDITANYLYAELLKTVIDFLECVESYVLKSIKISRNDKVSHVSAWAMRFIIDSLLFVC